MPNATVRANTRTLPVATDPCLQSVDHAVRLGSNGARSFANPHFLAFLMKLQSVE